MYTKDIEIIIYEKVFIAYLHVHTIHSLVSALFSMSPNLSDSHLKCKRKLGCMKSNRPDLKKGLSFTMNFTIFETTSHKNIQEYAERIIFHK
jgi:hypothetical protein